MSGNTGEGSTLADRWINISEAVALVVTATGWTDVEAAAWLLEAWEAGAITAAGMLADAEWRRQRGLRVGPELLAGARFGRARLLAALEELRSPPEAAAHKPLSSDAKRTAILPEGPIRGRRGGMSYDADDRRLINQMEELITRGDAKNPWQAAQCVANEAAGGGRLDAKAKRLLGKFQKRSALNGTERF